MGRLSRKGKIKTGLTMRNEETRQNPARGRDGRRNGEREEGEQEEAGRGQEDRVDKAGGRQCQTSRPDRAVSSVGTGGSGWQNVCVAPVPGGRSRDSTL